MHVVEVDGNTFFEVCPKSTKLENLLITEKDLKTQKNDLDQRARPLSKVTVFNQMRNARDEEFWKQLGQRMGRTIEQNRRAFLLRKGDAHAITMEDTYFDMKLPTIAGIESLPIKTLLTKPATPLKIEFSLDILEYLARVCTFEAQANPAKVENRLKRPREERFDNKGYAGITMRYGEYPRILARRVSNGNKQWKTFPIGANDDIDGMTNDAIAFVSFKDGDHDGDKDLDDDDMLDTPSKGSEIDTPSKDIFEEVDNLFSNEPIAEHVPEHESIGESLTPVKRSSKLVEGAPLIHRLLLASGSK